MSNQGTRLERNSLWMRLVPTILVVVTAVGVLVSGFRTGWRAPRFSDLVGSRATVEKEDWCTEHAVKESRCIKCHPELVGANINDWCPEHGVPESKCTICHPEILRTGIAGDWCREHGLPESSCTLCHPEIAVKGKVPASESGVTIMLAADTSSDTAIPSAPPKTPATAPAHHDHDDGHDHADNHGDDHAHDHGEHHGHDHASPESHAGHAHESNAAHGESGHVHVKDPATCQTHNLRVQFASAASVQKAGLKLAQVTERAMTATLSANAEVQYNRNRLAQISAPVAGRIWRVEKEVGEAVRQGEVIALIDAAEVGRAKAELLRAVADMDLKSRTLKRLKASAESGLRTGADLEEAEAAAKAASIAVFNAQQALINLGLPVRRQELEEATSRQRIQFLGLPSSIADTLDPETTTANLLPLTAPFDGMVIQRQATVGEVIEPSKPLVSVADLQTMWITGDIPLADARRVALGQTVTFRPDGAPDQSAQGKVSWISTAVDDQTRTVKVRAEVENPDNRLLANSFGKASITIRRAPTAIAVPSEAIQWEGCCYIVFVRLTDDIFQTRKVKLGSKVNGFTEILNGVLPGEVVVAEGSHVLKSEILKSALGAGCADGHH